MRRALLVSLLASLLPGCLPDLSPWQLVPPGGFDAGVIVGDAGMRDGGIPSQPNPIDYGAPCPNPHLVLVTLGNSSETARLVRANPGTGERCRSVPLLELQRDFGSAMYAVAEDPQGGLILGLGRGVLHLDAEGFPSWRYQPLGSGEFTVLQVVPFGSGAGARIAVLWQYSSSLNGLLLDAQGHRTSPADDAVEIPFNTNLLAVFPDASGRVLLAGSYGGISSYVINDATGTIGSAEGTVLFDGDNPDFDMLYGTRTGMHGDPTLGVLTLAHQDAVLRWRASDTTLSAPYTCTAHCGDFEAAVAGASDDVFAVCNAVSSSSTRHLVHMTGGAACTLMIDGTSLGDHRLSELALVHSAR